MSIHAKSKRRHIWIRWCREKSRHARGFSFLLLSRDGLRFTIIYALWGWRCRLRYYASLVLMLRRWFEAFHYHWHFIQWRKTFHYEAASWNERAFCLKHQKVLAYIALFMMISAFDGWLIIRLASPSLASQPHAQGHDLRLAAGSPARRAQSCLPTPTGPMYIFDCSSDSLSPDSSPSSLWDWVAALIDILRPRRCQRWYHHWWQRTVSWCRRESSLLSFRWYFNATRHSRLI